MENLTVVKTHEYPLKEGGTVIGYDVGGWSLEVIRNEDGSLDMETDANPEYAAGAVAAWTAWYEFLLAGGLDE